MSKTLAFLRNKFHDTHPVRLVWHRAAGCYAAVRYGFPARQLTVVFVTGTKGKTTTAWSLGQMLHLSGVPVAVSTTALFRIKDQTWANETKMTTLGRTELQRFLVRAVDEGCTMAIIEASSQAATQSRLIGIRGVGIVWTNLQSDHLEYHGGWEEYRAAKGQIFSQVRPGGFAILNADDAESSWFARRSEVCQLKTKSIGVKAGDFRISNLTTTSDGLTFDFAGLSGWRAPFSGAFNAQNLASAILAAHELGVPFAQLHTILPQVQPVPGRLENLQNKKGISVVIDFAYTAAALEQALLALRPRVSPGAKLWVVFGAVAGGRDASKRPIMASVAEKYADRVVLTDDDLGPEDNSTLVLSDIARGFSPAFFAQREKSWWEITPREEAVEFAITQAAEGDLILLAGKGCETVQHYGSRQRPYSERAAAEAALALR